jgi:3-phosphoshikimate 1-carboxyvinyltransferase
LPASGITGLKAFQFNATDCPDLFPPLVALAAYCNGTTVIEGLADWLTKKVTRLNPYKKNLQNWVLK